jgi:hypothetical protein
MKKLFIISALCLLGAINNNFLSASDNGENSDLSLVSLSGKVIDNGTGETLAGVLVKIDGSGKKIYTDFQGKFEIPDLLPGSYSISTSLISYESGELNLDLNGEEREPVKIKLNQVKIN